MRDCIVELLATEFEIVGVAADGRQALDSVDELRPDVVILDIAMPKMSGIEVARALKGRRTPPKVLFLSDYDEGALAEAALDCGAVGYVTKPRAAEELIPALHAVTGGKASVSKAISDPPRTSK
jgi:DNA-binding NarL/FixJ family response regulator